MKIEEVKNKLKDFNGYPDNISYVIMDEENRWHSFGVNEDVDTIIAEIEDAEDMAEGDLFLLEITNNQIDI